MDHPEIPRGSELTPEEAVRERRELDPSTFPKIDWTSLLKRIESGVPMDNPNLAEIPYSPPYMPIDPKYRELWNTLLSVGLINVQIVKQDGKIGFVFHTNQTIVIEKGKFYPFESCGGDEQQKAIGPYLKQYE